MISFRIAVLVSLGASALFGDSGAQPLFDALRRGDAAGVKAAVAGGADVNSRDAYGNTLLMQAALYGSAVDVEFLVSHGADVNAANHAGHTALMRAMPDLGKIRILAEHGANVNAATVEGETPLLIAAGIYSADGVVQYLIRKGAKVQAVDRGGRSPLVAAALAGSSGNLKVLLDAGADAKSRVENVDLLLPTGVKVDQSIIDRARRARRRATALMGAAASDCAECVRLLLDRGADAKAATGSGMTALHGAAYRGEPSVVNMLLRAGAPVNPADERGLTPLMMAANSRTKDPEVVRLLLEAGADVEAKDSSGRTVGEWARIGSLPEIRTLLRAPGAEVRADVRKASTSAPPAKDIHGAVEKSVALIEKVGPGFFRSTGCISCHNVSIPLMALSEARKRGYPLKPDSGQLMAKQTVAAFGPARDNLQSGYCSIPGMTSTAPYAAISMHGEGYAADPFTDGITRCLILEQRPDGSFPHGDTRPPLSPESSIPPTALSARSMQLYPVPALAKSVDASVVRARNYLLAAKPWYGDDYSYRLMGLQWTGATQAQIADAARDLTARQREDGGWAQSPYRESDAYATGLALSALSMTNAASISSAAYRRGVEYLLRTQEADGSWHVATRAFGFQPYFESGFPHGHDQWISMAGTAWSVMALLPAEPVRVAEK